jgi:hypothetical protein
LVDVVSLDLHAAKSVADAASAMAPYEQVIDFITIESHRTTPFTLQQTVIRHTTVC